MLFQFGGIGDTLMLTPVARALTKKFPGARIALCLTHKYVKDALDGHPYFNEIIPFDFYWKGYSAFLTLKNRRGGVLKVLIYHPKLFLTMASARFDLAIDYSLGPEIKNLSGALSYALSIPERVGYGDDTRGFLTKTVSADIRAMHRVDYYFEALKSLGVTSGDDHSFRYEFPLSPDDIGWGRDFLKSNGRKRSLLVAMHPGGAKLMLPRRWPAENFISVGKWVIDELGGQVLLTGGREDEEVCKTVGAALGARCINACGKTTLRQTAALLSLCGACVTNDTATVHLASAVHMRNICVIIGPSDPSLYLPHDENLRVFRASVDCAPCIGSIIGSETQACSAAKPGLCLTSVTPEQIIEALKQVMLNHSIDQSDCKSVRK